MNHSTKSPSHLSAIEAGRRKDGKFGHWHANEGPTPNLPADPGTIVTSEVTVTDSNDGPAPGGAITQLVRRSHTTEFDGYHVEAVDYAWVETTTAGYPFGQDEHNAAQMEQQGYPDEIDFDEPVVGIDYHVASARMWKVSRDGKLLSETTQWSSTVHRVDNIVEGSAEAEELVNAEELDLADVELHVSDLPDNDEPTQGPDDPLWEPPRPVAEQVDIDQARLYVAAAPVIKAFTDNDRFFGSAPYREVGGVGQVEVFTSLYEEPEWVDVDGDVSEFVDRGRFDVGAAVSQFDYVDSSEAEEEIRTLADADVEDEVVLQHLRKTY